MIIIYYVNSFVNSPSPNRGWRIAGDVPLPGLALVLFLEDEEAELGTSVWLLLPGLDCRLPSVPVLGLRGTEDNMAEG